MPCFWSCYLRVKKLYSMFNTGNKQLIDRKGRKALGLSGIRLWLAEEDQLKVAEALTWTASGIQKRHLHQGEVTSINLPARVLFLFFFFFSFCIARDLVSRSTVTWYYANFPLHETFFTKLFGSPQKRIWSWKLEVLEMWSNTWSSERYCQNLTTLD